MWVGGALLLQGRLSPGELLVACGGLYVGVRHLAGAVFKRFTVHRGIWHSLLAAGLCGLVTTALSYRLLAQEAGLAWAQGLALLLGCIIHLLLDELYSVDLVGARIKRSFGSALKLCDLREPGNSALMLLLAAVAYLMSNTFANMRARRGGRRGKRECGSQEPRQRKCPLSG